MSKEEGFTSPNTGDTRPIEAPTDQWGETHQDLDRYPEGSAARSGESTVPSGQGGATPHDGTSYQDQFPPNPEPDEYTLAWGQYLAEKERGGDPDPPDMAAIADKNKDKGKVKAKRSDKESAAPKAPNT